MPPATLCWTCLLEHWYVSLYQTLDLSRMVFVGFGICFMGFILGNYHEWVVIIEVLQRPRFIHGRIKDKGINVGARNQQNGQSGGWQLTEQSL